MSDLPAEIFKRWVHSHEEDEGDVMVFRPAGHPLPPARGRTGFEIRRDGGFMRYGIGADDRGTAKENVWEAASPNRIQVKAAGEEHAGQTMDVVEVGNDVLKVRVSPRG
jgi:hypothetical protein